MNNNKSLAPFAYTYQNLLQSIIKKYPTSVKPRNFPLKYEIINYSMGFTVDNISIYSEKHAKAFPMTFALAELCWILSGSDKVHPLLKPLDKYSVDGLLIGAYGKRLLNLIPIAIYKLVSDIDTRQCVLPIFQSGDLIFKHPDIPCNTQLQFIIRDNRLNMTVTSRSSDILTGLPIDAFQWQCLFHLILNELNEIMHNIIKPGIICYNIGSLHMYSADVPMFEQFVYSSNSKKYEHNISIYQTYSNARDRSVSKFPNAKNISNLLEIIDVGSFTQINSIQEIFRNRVHKISRDAM